MIGNNKKIKDCQGFSLLEIVVSLSIFTCVMLAAMGIFQSVIMGQREAIAARNIQESLRYLSAVMSKEMQSAKTDDSGICNGSPSQIFSTNAANSQIKFINFNDECVNYSLAGNKIMVSRDNHIATATPDNIQVKNFKVNIVEAATSQPRVTFGIDAVATTTTGHKQELNLQTTVSSKQIVLTNAFACGTSLDYNGDTYPTLQIGSQCWMAENLRTITYPDGSIIQKGPVASDSNWNDSSKAYYACPPDVSNTSGAEDCASANGSQLLGYPTIGSFVDSNDQNFINSSVFTMPNQAGLSTSISIYVKNPISPTPNNKFQAGIYSDSSGLPGSLVASTSSGILVGDSWNTLAISANLLPNIVYWVAFNTNALDSSHNRLVADSIPSGKTSWKAQTFGTWPVVLSAPIGESSGAMGSGYVTYNITKLGMLYQWKTAMNGSTVEGAQGICPDNWHLPSDAEWKSLEMSLGMTQAQVDLEGDRGTNQGAQLRDGGPTNFDAPATGYRQLSGVPSYRTSRIRFWSSSVYDSTSAETRQIYASANDKVNRTHTTKTYASSVRCVLD